LQRCAVLLCRPWGASTVRRTVITLKIKIPLQHPKRVSDIVVILAYYDDDDFYFYFKWVEVNKNEQGNMG
jgi:hypothetical protein